MKKYAKNLKEARELLQQKNSFRTNGIEMFKLKSKRTKTRRYFIGSYMEWLNL